VTSPPTPHPANPSSLPTMTVCPTLVMMGIFSKGEKMRVVF